MLEENKHESPDYAKLSLAADMTLGFRGGRFWRDARMTCINLLLTYRDSCKANCSYCGLARDRVAEEKTFIHVPWPIRSLDEIITALNPSKIARRTCISMITHKRSKQDTLSMTSRLVAETRQSVSILLTPTITDKDYLKELKKTGVDKIGIAIDAATEKLFDRHRGRGVNGPHKWDTYWERFEEAIEIFGPGQVGSHFIYGLGEQEKDLVQGFQRVNQLKGVNHLFSFYPEKGSALSDLKPSPMAGYRRIQIACHLIDEGLSKAEDFIFDSQDGHILDFGVSQDVLDQVIDSGEPFKTRGCKNCDGEVDCNRPFGNSYPGPDLRNYPFQPDRIDIERIREQLVNRPSLSESSPSRSKRIIFAVPNIKQYSIDAYSNRGRPNFLAVSVTGKSCQLLCDHCKAKLLKPMISTRTPEGLWSFAEKVSMHKGIGILISGGCTKEGIVPLEPFCPTIARIKKELNLKIAVHSKFVTRPLAKALATTGLDAVMMDVPSSEQIIQNIYHLPNYGFKNVEETLNLLEEYDLPAAPHLLLGFGEESSRRSGVEKSLNLLEGRNLQSLVIVFLMPLPGTPMPKPEPMPIKEIDAVFQKIRNLFPHGPVYLGCARPPGKYQIKLEMLALKHAFNGIAFPTDETVEVVKKRKYEIEFQECCCALVE